ncbi:CBS domain-containing protein [Ferrovibrio sp.]|uniref:CBS domain-containing protein n=1 Tax=Ferrovibrio sp. TaxID=1917215 RepID=UPI001B680BBA|nr:CBS domain-containing protein [Ferrovibrio sp.]MBP7064381.1 CBS domain-containing protein [Ferrovibrio sp.]
MNVAMILKEKGGDMVAAKPGDSLAAVCSLLAGHGIGAVLVLNPDGGIAGILSERDVVRGLAQHGGALLERSAESLMTRNVMVCAPADTIEDVMHVMTKRRIRHLPVMAEGKLVGMISIGDVVKRRIADTELEAEALRQYIATG